MVLAPKLEIKQGPALTLTPQLRQAISLLQMTNIELNDFVEQELASNPLLEREDDFLSQSDDIEVSDEKNSDDTNKEDDFVVDYDEQNNFDDFGSDTEGYSSFEDVDWSDYRQNKAHLQADDDFDYFSERLAHEKSLYEIIREQIDLNFIANTDKMLAIILLENLDPSGYFTADISKIATKIKIEEKRLQSILDEMKKFEPTGIFAQNLAECLKIQAQDAGLLDDKMEFLLKNLSFLAEGKTKELCKLCDCEADYLNEMLKKIRGFNPKPAAGFINNFNTNIVPDVLVKRNANGEYRVELNSISLPRVLINHRYYSEMKEHKNAVRYLKDNMSRASFLVKAMHSRATSILRISEEIVLRQYHFLEKGIEYLKPMTLKDVAGALDLSESTVSRVVCNKYMMTPVGMFELKYFFSNAAGSYLGNDDISTTTIKHKIMKLVEAEGSKVLSDEQLVDLLENDGIKIARRTVAKYRESLGIATSAIRKRLKRGSQN